MITEPEKAISFGFATYSKGTRMVGDCAVASLVRAIRRAMRGRTHKHSDQIDSWPTDTLVSFRVDNIHDFAARLVEEGVNVSEEAA